MSSESAAKENIVLGYWNIRGLAQPLRLLLKYTGTNFEDVRYTQGNGPTFSHEEWRSVKDTLGLDFPNIPYLIDGDLKITQSNAILSHLGRKNNLYGKTEATKAVVDMLINVAMDFRNGFVRLCYNSQYETLRDGYLKNVVTILKKLSDFLGADKPWFAGSDLTCADFHLYELLDQHRIFDSQILDNYPNLKEYLDRFEELPAIKEYMASSEFTSWPINNKIAQWGGTALRAD